jgi:hypothetical protein
MLRDPIFPFEPKDTRRYYECLQGSAIEKIFAELAERWWQDTAHLSSYRDILMHPAYLQIIGLGMDALLPILRDLEQREHTRMWFEALSSITRENPIPESMAGNMPEMTAAWLKWGRSKGYL